MLLAGTELTSPVAGELASLLEGYREEVVAGWVRLLHNLPGGHFARTPLPELQSCLRDELGGIVAIYRQHTYAPLDHLITARCEEQVRDGFDVSEMIQGKLLLKDAVMPIILREAENQHETALQMLAELDRVLHWIVIRVSKVYSVQLSGMLAAQVDRLTHSEEQLRERNAQLEQQSKQLERRVREVTALNRSTSLITSTLEADKVMDLILEQLAEVIGYDSATIMWMVEGVLRIIACRGFRDPSTVLGSRFDPRENVLTARLISEAQPIVLQDVLEEPTFYTDPGDCTRAWIGVPLIVRDNCIGALTLDKCEREYYDAEDGHTVMAFANQAAIALENARLYDRSRDLAVLEERNRLARELHDSISQMLFSMVLNAEAAAAMFEVNPASAQVQIARLQETSHAALKDMRTLIFELRPANLEEEGLVPVLRKHIALVKERYGLDVQFYAEGQQRWPFRMEKALYRITQEALTNIIKHADATHAMVNLSAAEGSVRLTVDDNGRGLTPARAGEAAHSTLGLTSMRERAEQLGGTFAIGPRPDSAGTRVSVTLPYATD